MKPAVQALGEITIKKIVRVGSIERGPPLAKDLKPFPPAMVIDDYGSALAEKGQ